MESARGQRYLPLFPKNARDWVYEPLKNSGAGPYWDNYFAMTPKAPPVVHLLH